MIDVEGDIQAVIGTRSYKLTQKKTRFTDLFVIIIQQGSSEKM